MVTLGQLRADPSRLKEFRGCDVLLGLSGGGGDEVLVRDDMPGTTAPRATMVFMHETIAMMRAERAGQGEKLLSILGDDAFVLALEKKPESLWEHITLGRASSADLTVADPAVSSVHAHFALNVDGNPVSVQDVGSSNGTHINRQPLQPHELIPLRNGDCVRFGQSIFYYVTNSLLEEMLSPRE